MPYWYGIPANTPAGVTVVLGPPLQFQVGQSLNVYFRITDSAGIAVVDRAALNYNGTAAAGGGTVSDLSFSTAYPNLVYATIKMGADAGVNTFRFSFGNLPPVTLNVEGIKP